MIEQLQPIEVKVNFPREARTLILLFAPTHSQIETAVLGSADSDEISENNGIKLRGVAVGFVFPAGFSGGELKIAVTYQGEPVILFTTLVYRDPLSVEELNNNCSELYRRMDLDRGKLAKFEANNGNHGQEFFYELDRNTSDPFIQFTGLSVVEQQERLRIFDLVRRQLGRRILDRYCRRAVSPPPKYEHLQLITRIFIACAKGFPSDPRYSQLGQSLGDFAAGWLHRIVFVDTGASEYRFKPVPFTEPDSILVFAFAELAFASRDSGVEPQFWTNLLPHLIQMQRYYLARFPCQCLDKYKIADHWLTPPDRRGLDSKWPSLNFEQLMFENLRSTDTSCEGRLCRL